MTYNSHFCTIAVCCPSRATLWTGLAAHNTNVTDVTPPYGGYPKVVAQGFNEENLFLWMQRAGYNTYYTGKLYNAHTIDNYDDPYARGFNGSDFLLDPYTYKFFGAAMVRNDGEVANYTGQYNTDVIAQKTFEFLAEALSHPDPFFIVSAPIAPHADLAIDPGSGLTYFAPPEAAPRHKHMFNDYKIPRNDPSFNKVIVGGPSWPGKLQPMNETELEYNDEFQRKRLRSLQAVDEMVGGLVTQLRESGELDNTFIFYTTDNGYHVSQHAMNPGKSCGYGK